jgi:rubrerythrin
MAGASPVDIQNLKGVDLDSNELRKAIRLSIAAEFDAANLYELIAEGCADEKVKAVMIHVANEERVHAGEFMKLLSEIFPKELEHWKEGEEEAAGTIYGNEMTGDAEAEAEPEIGEPFVQKTTTQPLDNFSNQALEGLNEEVDDVLKSRRYRK